MYLHLQDVKDAGVRVERDVALFKYQSPETWDIHLAPSHYFDVEDPELPLEGLIAKEAVLYTQQFYDPATRAFDTFDPDKSEYTVTMFIADFEPQDRYKVNPFESDKHPCIQYYFF